MSHATCIKVAFTFFVSELWPFDCIFMLILCNLHSYTPHNSLTVRDIFIQFYRKDDESRARMISPVFCFQDMAL